MVRHIERPDETPVPRELIYLALQSLLPHLLLSKLVITAIMKFVVTVQAPVTGVGKYLSMIVLSCEPLHVSNMVSSVLGQLQGRLIPATYALMCKRLQNLEIHYRMDFTSVADGMFLE